MEQETGPVYLKVDLAVGVLCLFLAVLAWFSFQVTLVSEAPLTRHLMSALAPSGPRLSKLTVRFLDA